MAGHDSGCMRPPQAEAMPASEVGAEEEEAAYEEARTADATPQHAQPEQAPQQEPAQQQPDRAPAALQAEHVIAMEEVDIVTTPQELQQVWCWAAHTCAVHPPLDISVAGSTCMRLVPAHAACACTNCHGCGVHTDYGPGGGAAAGDCQERPAGAPVASVAGCPVGDRP